MPKMTKNKITQAAALKYDHDGQHVPKVVAKGERIVAEKLIELAKENNIPIKEDKELVAILSSLDINEEIPLEIYSIVAEIFAFLYNENNKLKN